MNFLQISLTNKCNFACPTCPMGKWRNSEPPRWPLYNAELIPWLEKYIQPSQWVVELTGGEPSLYDGIEDLMRWLSEHGYRTLVKTNGSGNLPHLPNVKLVAAFHKLEQPPRNYDEYLIVDKLQRTEKELYCIDNGIKYNVIGFNKDRIDEKSHPFVHCAYINPAGHQLGCMARSAIEGVRNGVDYRRITHRPLVAMDCCSHCKAAIDAWRYLEDML